MSSRQNLCGRLSAIGLRKETVLSFVNELQKYEKRNGPEWTIDRLKDVKSYYVSKISQTIWQPKTWFSRFPNGEPKGPLTSLPVFTVKQQWKALNASMAYSNFVANKVTDKQMSKFLGSAVNPNSDSLLNYRAMSNFVNHELRKQLDVKPGLDYSQPETYYRVNDSKSMPGKKLSHVSCPKPFFELSWSPSKKAPMVRKKRSAEDRLDWVQDNLTCAKVNNLVTKYKALSIPAGFYQYALSTEVSDKVFDSAVGGNISFLQEPGYKLRAIANPFRIHQVMLKPLQDWSLSILRQYGKDCTFDQSSGHSWCQEQLRSGNLLHAVDLSDATNNFPLDFQVKAISSRLDLSDKLSRESLMYFMEVSRSTWKLPDGSHMTFNRGQPLGLGPSFSCFAMSHHDLLSPLVEKWGGDYRILGDDIVIHGDDLHSAYRDGLLELQVPVSESKCISSDKLIEFAGRYITKDSIICTPKWRMVSDRSFIEFARMMGPQSLTFLRPRQRQVLNHISELPEFIGGLGWNPKGVPLSVRLDKAVALGLFDDKSKIVPFRSLSASQIQSLNRIAYECNLPWHQPLTDYNSSTRGVLERVNSITGVKDGFSDPSNLGSFYTSGTLSQGDPRGKTLLESWEDDLRSFIEYNEDKTLESFLEDSDPSPYHTMGS